MDSYIRDYTHKQIETTIIQNFVDIGTYNNDTNNLKLLHINIRSIAKNLDELILFINKINIEYDIIILSETWKVDNLGLHNLNGYNIYYNNGDTNQNDGVIVYIKKEIKSKWSIYLLPEINNKILKIEIEINGKLVLISAIYRSPSSDMQKFNIHLNDYLRSIEKKGIDYYLLVGDINIDILNDNNKNPDDYLNILSEFNYLSYINKPTRVGDNSSSCIDHIFLKCKNSVHEKNKSFIYEYQITDHFPIALFFNIETTLKNQLQAKNKSYINYNLLERDLQKESWDIIYKNEKTISNITNIFIDSIKFYIKKNTYTITITNKKHSKIKRPWITKGLLNSIDIKNTMYKNLKKNKNNAFLNEQYKNYKNKLQMLLKKSKIKYIKEQIQQNKGNTSQLWKTIGSICQEGKSHEIISCIKDGDHVLTNPILIANTFNKYFSNVGKSLADKIDCPQENNADSAIHNANSIYLSEVTDLEILDAIRELKNNKLPGIDGIKSEVIKKIAPLILKPFSYIINRIINEGTCPEIFKIGIIKPLFKEGDKELVSNYRPITLISNFAKIFEKILKKRLTCFLDKYNILSDMQYGFREGRSTQDAICDLTSRIYDSLDKNEPTLAIFVDLAKAFDTVCHTKLLDKLNAAGIRGKAHKLLKSYLENRVNYVSIENINSNPEKVWYGVPQGTVLGPLLFSLYINDLLNINSAGKIISFADDTVVLYKSHSWNALRSLVQSDLSNIFQWFQSNVLTLNSKKTKYIAFSSYKVNIPHYTSIEITVNKNKIKLSEHDNIKYLGVMIDRHMRWDQHTSLIVKKIRGIIPKLKYLKEYLDLSELKIIYHSLIQSHINYGILAWGGVNNNYLHALNVIQKWSLKIILNKNYTYPTDMLFREAGVLDVRQLFGLAMCLQIYKNKSLLHFNTHEYNTRSKTSRLPKNIKCCKTIGQRCHTYLRTKMYTSLPSNIKQINSFHSFKKLLKKWILDKPRNDIHAILEKNCN